MTFRSSNPSQLRTKDDPPQNEMNDAVAFWTSYLLVYKITRVLERAIYAAFVDLPASRHTARRQAPRIRPNSGSFCNAVAVVRPFAVHVSARVRPRPPWAWPGQHEQLVSCRMGGWTLWTLFSCRRRRRRSFCGVLMSQSRNPCCAIPPF